MVVEHPLKETVSAKSGFPCDKQMPGELFRREQHLRRIGLQCTFRLTTENAGKYAGEDARTLNRYLTGERGGTLGPAGRRGLRVEKKPHVART
jgi:hypothetical protein